MRFLIFILSLSIFISCRHNDKSVSIYIQSTKEDHSTYALLDINTKEVLLLDTVSLKKGIGKMEVNLQKGLYALQKNNNASLYYLYLIPGEKVKIHTKGKNYAVTGSPNSDSLLSLVKQEKWLATHIVNIDTQIPKVKGKYVDSLLLLKKNIHHQYMGFMQLFIEHQPEPEVACFALTYLKDGLSSTPFMMNAVEKLYKKAPESQYILLWKNALTQYQETATESFTDGLPIGSYAPDITTKTPQGDTIILKDLKGKYVLLDFWASWCQPCRKNNPTIVALHKDLQGKNFDIFSFSLDKKAEQWLRAIKVDNLSWYYHGCDFGEWNSPIAISYKVESIPTTYLINPKGKIIGRDLPTDSIKAIVIKGL